MPKKVKDPQESGMLRAMMRVHTHGLDTVDDVEAFATEILQSPWFMVRWPKVAGVNVLDGRGTKMGLMDVLDFGDVTVGNLSLPYHFRTRLIVEHEIAHTCLGEGDPEPPHSPKFMGIWLAIVGRFEGRRKRDELARELSKEGVTWKVYRHHG